MKGALIIGGFVLAAVFLAGCSGPNVPDANDWNSSNGNNGKSIEDFCDFQKDYWFNQNKAGGEAIGVKLVEISEYKSTKVCHIQMMTGNAERGISTDEYFSKSNPDAGWIVVENRDSGFKTVKESLIIGSEQQCISFSCTPAGMLCDAAKSSFGSGCP